ncbi:glycosyltransferase [Alkalihalobacillus sp. MEB130]|uniref:glycosyltransferase family 2 protein n=1 Tax=Alkalihalobacillus sp. MEB130 TaxID=2976704 RepID=UPI0028DD467A|nr:glycosyltransferase [Alkalihalobacillus sp. MEB130]MDT8861092.1 glycosyltransferase [Alkalihalobacillus sp. MEB130]
MNPKISIIVPIYNVEKYLKQCLDSILAQTFKDFELILVNDGSPDNCGEICEEYAKNDYRVIVIHKENNGVASARNSGIEIAKGEYVGFVDPDDDIEPNMYEVLYEQASLFFADMVVCPIKTINLKTKETKVSTVWETVDRPIDKNNIKANIIPSILNSNYYSLLSCCNKLYRRYWFNNKKIKFDETRHHGEDARLNLLMLQQVNNIVFKKKPLYNYYIRNEKSLTQTFRLDFYDYYLDSKNFGVALCNKYNVPHLVAKIENKFVINTLNHMQSIVYSEFSSTKKLEYLTSILKDDDFTKILVKCPSPSIYYRLLKWICLMKNEKAFVTIVKVKKRLKKI